MLRVVECRLFVDCISVAVPVAVVENLSYNADTVNATHGELTWDSVDVDVRKIRGFFHGYQVPFSAPATSHSV